MNGLSAVHACNIVSRGFTLVSITYSVTDIIQDYRIEWDLVRKFLCLRVQASSLRTPPGL